MLLSILLATLLGLVAAESGGGLNFVLDLDEYRCFYEEVMERDSKVFMHVQIRDGGYDVRLDVSGPFKPGEHEEPSQADPGNVIYTTELMEAKGERRLLFRGKDGGAQYRFCFQNGGAMMKSVMLSLKSNDPMEVRAGPYKAMEPIRKTIIRLSESLNGIKEDQQYLRTRERIHRDAAEATYERIVFWSVTAIVALLAISGGQIYYYYSILGSEATRGRGV